MIRNLLSIGRLLPYALGVATLSAGVGWYGTSAQAQGANPEQQLSSLRQQVAALERRVAEVEKLKGGAVLQNSTSADARVKALEQRLASLEGALASRNADAKPGPQERQALVTFTAPFVVVDRAGKPLMRVQEDADGGFSRGIYVYDSNGSSVTHMGVMQGGGRVYVSKPGVLPAAMMAAAPDGPMLGLSDNAKYLVKIDKQSLVYYNDAKTAIAVFGSKDRSKGYLELNDAGGKIMVEAGSLADHKGYVLASPYETRGGVLGDPSVLKGGNPARAK
jgi:hypothetical protein